MSSFNLNKFNPPPPPPLIPRSENISAAEIDKQIASTPSHAYLQGIPVQYVSLNNFYTRTPLILDDITIDFSVESFTYLNFSNTTTDAASKIIVRLKHVPIGTFFMVNGPTSWISYSGQLILEDKDNSGNNLTNSILDIPARGVEGSPSNYVNILVGRDSTGLVAKALT